MSRSNLAVASDASSQPNQDQLPDMALVASALVSTTPSECHARLVELVASNRFFPAAVLIAECYSLDAAAEPQVEEMAAAIDARAFNEPHDYIVMQILLAMGHGAPNGALERIRKQRKGFQLKDVLDLAMRCEQAGAGESTAQLLTHFYSPTFTPTTVCRQLPKLIAQLGRSQASSFVAMAMCQWVLRDGLDSDDDLFAPLKSALADGQIEPRSFIRAWVRSSWMGSYLAGTPGRDTDRVCQQYNLIEVLRGGLIRRQVGYVPGRTLEQRERLERAVQECLVVLYDLVPGMATRSRYRNLRGIDAALLFGSEVLGVQVAESLCRTTDLLFGLFQEATEWNDFDPAFYAIGVAFRGASREDQRQLRSSLASLLTQASSVRR